MKYGKRKTYLNEAFSDPSKLNIDNFVVNLSHGVLLVVCELDLSQQLF